ncbi:AcrR family transcriptional regulator [Actinopolyspora biskrensis]|uniref:AcrR family transcriptional regulator n=1 Tax=Actinopolyspora biskrensis TaxID=1470178 RepID=A0A852YZK4_9ACTN|nr:TetR/AcrR family transcriptional regulator [Actinopolyspora biskrensis]NYH79172.1 AcrR family transcriptional regulator [Actinopolyspora biskrensis]
MSYSRPTETPGDKSAGVPSRGVRARRAELLDRLCDLFLAEGFAHFTLDELAARLHCSKSTLYTLARSKEQLAVRVVGHFFKRATANIELRVAEVADARSSMRVYLKAAAAELAPAGRRFIADMADNPATRACYEANATAAADRIRSVVHEGVRTGVFREVDAALVGEMVGLTISAIQRGEITERTGLSDAAAFDALSDFLVGGLAVPEEGREAADTHRTEEP